MSGSAEMKTSSVFVETGNAGGFEEMNYARGFVAMVYADDCISALSLSRISPTKRALSRSEIK